MVKTVNVLFLQPPMVSRGYADIQKGVPAGCDR